MQPPIIQEWIRQFYDWSFHGPNIIKNDDEWFEFDQETGMFRVKMIAKSSKPSKPLSTEEAFKQTLRTIKIMEITI